MAHPDNSGLKRKEPSSHEKTWRHLKCLLRTERSQSEKVTYCMVPPIQHSGKGQTMETIKRSVTAGGGRGGIYRQSPVDF